MKNEWIIIWGASIETLQEVLQFIRREQVRVCSGNTKWTVDYDCHAIYLRTEDGLFKKNGEPWDYPFQKITQKFPEIRIKLSYFGEPDAGQETMFAGSKTPDDSLIGDLEANLSRATEIKTERVQPVEKQIRAKESAKESAKAKKVELCENYPELALVFDRYDLEVEELDEFEHLELCDWDIESIKFLNALPALRSLDLDDNQISDLTPLIDCPQLESLSLNNNTVSDLGPLSYLKKLQRLEIHGNLVRDLSPLAELQSLKTLYIQNNWVQDRSPLDELPNLTRVFDADNPCAEKPARKDSIASTDLEKEFPESCLQNDWVAPLRR